MENDGVEAMSAAAARAHHLPLFVNIPANLRIGKPSFSRGEEEERIIAKESSGWFGAPRKRSGRLTFYLEKPALEFHPLGEKTPAAVFCPFPTLTLPDSKSVVRSLFVAHQSSPRLASSCLNFVRFHRASWISLSAASNK